MTRLYAADDHINWAAIAGALCAWDLIAKRNHTRTASQWFRDHQFMTIIFLFALTNHLTRRDLIHTS